ncbi:hypothetical protein ACR6C2_29000 [Streptomyces sp. INA 01156]
MTTNTPTRPQPTAPDAADRAPAHTGFALFSARIRAGTANRAPGSCCWPSAV